MRYDSPRSAPRRRRRWLRELDSPLGREFEDAGALSCAELVELSAEPLRGCASPQTVEEWWQYADRRADGSKITAMSAVVSPHSVEPSCEIAVSATPGPSPDL